MTSSAVANSVHGRHPRGCTRTIGAPKVLRYAPWRADRPPHGYVVRDAHGQSIAFVYGRATEAEAMQAKVLTMVEDKAHLHQHCETARAAGEG